jgi:hypothetical protein
VSTFFGQPDRARRLHVYTGGQEATTLKTFSSRHGRLMAQCTRMACEVSPQEARRRDIMIRARRISTLERKARRLRGDLAACRLALKLARREFAIISTPPDIEIGPGDHAVTLAGR